MGKLRLRKEKGLGPGSANSQPLHLPLCRLERQEGGSCLGWSGKAFVEQTFELSLQNYLEFWKAKMRGREGMPGGRNHLSKGVAT